jgi:hypothetical protein
MGWSEFGLVGLLFCIGMAVVSWMMGMGIHCKTKGKEGSMVSYALGDSLASANSAEIK